MIFQKLNLGICIGCFVCAVLFASSPSNSESPASDLRTTNTASKLKMLEPHADSLPPVHEQLRAGVTFNKSLLPGGSFQNYWYKIPSWFAGVRSCEERTTLSVFDYNTNALDQTVTNTDFHSSAFSGFQKDKAGNIWEFKRPPYWIEIDRGDSILCNCVNVTEPIEIKDDTVELKFVYNSLVIDKATWAISTSSQSESMNLYTKIGGDVVQVVSSDKVFDQLGKPQSIAKRTAIYKMRAFEPVNLYEGRDMKKLFKEFLASSGQLDLLPIDAASSVKVEKKKTAPSSNIKRTQRRRN